MTYIYLHGFCSGQNSFKGTYFREKFAEKNIQLLTPDLNGEDFEHLTITSQLDIIENLAKSISGDTTIIGSSMGGYLAILFAQNNPRVKKLVAIAPAFQFIKRQLILLGKERIERWQEQGTIEVFHHQYNEGRQLHHDIIEDAMGYEGLILDRKIPALILHGIYDDTVLYRLSIDYLKINTDAQLLLLNSDHTMTDIVNTLWKHVRQFLEI
jgi:pimeloyl-ACP methyl ester carboxylesterase